LTLQTCCTSRSVLSSLPYCYWVSIRGAFASAVIIAGVFTGGLAGPPLNGPHQTATIGRCAASPAGGSPSSCPLSLTIRTIVTPEALPQRASAGATLRPQPALCVSEPRLLPVAAAGLAGPRDPSVPVAVTGYTSP